MNNKLIIKYIQEQTKNMDKCNKKSFGFLGSFTYKTIKAIMFFDANYAK